MRAVFVEIQLRVAFRRMSANSGSEREKAAPFRVRPCVEGGAALLLRSGAQGPADTLRIDTAARRRQVLRRNTGHGRRSALPAFDNFAAVASGQRIAAHHRCELECVRTD